MTPVPAIGSTTSTALVRTDPGPRGSAPRWPGTEAPTRLSGADRPDPPSSVRRRHRSPRSVTDEDRTRYGRSSTSAAERGLLDPADYEVRLRELAEATTIEEMTEIVTELPAFTAPIGQVGAGADPTVHPVAPAGRGSAPGQRRRVVMWALMGLLVVVALALPGDPGPLGWNACRTSRSGSSASTPVATRPVSALRL